MPIYLYIIRTPPPSPCTYHTHMKSNNRARDCSSCCAIKCKFVYYNILFYLIGAESWEFIDYYYSQSLLYNKAAATAIIAIQSVNSKISSSARRHEKDREDITLGRTVAVRNAYFEFSVYTPANVLIDRVSSSAERTIRSIMTIIIILCNG